MIVRIVAWPFSPERNRTDSASDSVNERFGFDRKAARVSGPESVRAIGGITAAPWVRRISRKSASVAYLSSTASAIGPCSARASTAWLRRVASAKSS